MDRTTVADVLRMVTPDDAIDEASLDEAVRLTLPEVDRVKAEVFAFYPTPVERACDPSATHAARAREMVKRLVRIRNDHLRALFKFRIEAPEFQRLCQVADG